MAGRFSIEAVFTAVDRITRPVTRIQNRVGKMTRAMTRGFDRLNRSVDKFGKLAKRGALAATAAMAATGVAMLDVIKTGAAFESTLVAAAAKFPGEIRKGTEAFKLLEDAARKTGATTEFSASQAAEALNFLAMAGLNAESSVAALPGVVDLATAANIDLGEATDVATDSLGAFGLATKDATQLGKNLARINDVIAKTTTTANTDVATMFETITKGAAVATAAGASLETFAALTGVLANAGTKGSVAGTTLKNVFTSLAKPSKEAAKLLGKLGISTKDSAGDMRDVIDVLGDVDKALGKSGTAGRLEAITTLFGKIPLAGVNVLLKAGTKQLKDYRTELEGAGGSAKTMADTMRDTVTGRFKGLTSAIEGVKISIFDTSKGPLADILDKLTTWVRLNEKVIASNLGTWMAGLIGSLSNIDKWLDVIIVNFESIVSWAQTIGTALAVFFVFSSVLKTIVLIMTALNLIMLLNPVGLIVLGVVALITAFTALFFWIEEILEGFDSMPAVLRFILGPIRVLFSVVKGIKDLVGGIVGFFTGGKKIDLTATFDAAQGPAAVPERVAKKRGFFAGLFDSDDGEKKAPGATAADGPQVVSPQERAANSIEERRETSTAEVTIRDETRGNRASVTKGKLGRGVTLQPSGSF